MVPRPVRKQESIEHVWKLGKPWTFRRFVAESATKEEAAEFVANVEQVLAAQNYAWVGPFSAKSGA
jgi:hypothetical protein